MEAVETRVDDLTHDGCGIARHDNRVYFVDGVIPGEIIRFLPGKKRRGRLSGKLEEIIINLLPRPFIALICVVGRCSFELVRR